METEYREQYIRFGLKVQYYRKLRGLTQEAFADRVGKSWSYIAKIESPTRAFGVSMETLAQPEAYHWKRCSKWRRY